MTTPTPYPYGPDPQARAATVPAPRSRPGAVTAAAVLAFILGALGVVGNLLVLSAFSSLDVTAVFVVLTVIAAVADVALFWGGVQAIIGRDGRTVVVAAGLLIVVNLTSVVIHFNAVGLLGFIVPVLIVALMLLPSSKQWLDSREAPHF